MSSEEELPTLGQAGQAGSMHEVYEGIYVGNYAAAKHRMFLRKHGISHVLAVRTLIQTNGSVAENLHAFLQAAADMGELHPGSFIYKMVLFPCDMQEDDFDHLTLFPNYSLTSTMYLNLGICRSFQKRLNTSDLLWVPAGRFSCTA